MSMSVEIQQQISWLRHEDICSLLASEEAPSPWFPAYQHINSVDGHLSWFSSLVPISLIPTLLKDSSWDIRPGDGRPSIMISS